jgi:hydrogenase-1 operon protein HyaF
MTEAAEQVPRPAVYCRQDRGNDQPVLSELHHALDELLLHGKETIIDIKSLPFGSFDEQRLAAALGKGEVEAVVHALGESRITETAYPGIWWVEHRGEQGQIIAKFLEVAFVPGILKSQREDVAAAGRRLGAVVESQFREMQIGNESGVERE